MVFYMVERETPPRGNFWVVFVQPCFIKTAGFPAPAPAPWCVTKIAGFPCPVLKKCAGSERISRLRLRAGCQSRAHASVAPRCVTKIARFPARRRPVTKNARVQSEDCTRARARAPALAAGWPLVLAAGAGAGVGRWCSCRPLVLDDTTKKRNWKPVAL